MSEQDFLNAIQQHQSTLHHLLNLYLKGKEDKEDMAQEICYQAWKSKDHFKGQSSFNTWFYKLCLYCILTTLRKSKKDRCVSIEQAHHVQSPERLQLDTSDRLYTFISGLNDSNKTIITMHLDGFSNQEIAEFLGISLNALNVRLCRLKETITQNLIKYKNGNS